IKLRTPEVVYKEIMSIKEEIGKLKQKLEDITEIIELRISEEISKLELRLIKRINKVEIKIGKLEEKRD
ncbi:MAG: hypothetical protein ACE5KT_10245, partial [Methanosarcinales archaeon]